MKKPTTISKESVSEYREFVQLRLRKRVLEAIEVVLEEEVDQALGCRSYERAEDRCGYRNGAETRRVTTSVGTRELRVPRARVRDRGRRARSCRRLLASRPTWPPEPRSRFDGRASPVLRGPPCAFAHQPSPYSGERLRHPREPGHILFISQALETEEPHHSEQQTEM